MEPGGVIMEGGEWNSFNGVYVNEEASFMAQLFPTNCSLAANDTVDGGPSLACWSNNFNMATGSIYASSDAAANSNLYSSFSQESCYSGGSGIVAYPTAAGHENYYVCDNSHQFLAGINNTAMLLEFRDDKVEAADFMDKERHGEVEHADNSHMLPKRESEMSLELEDKNSDCSDNPRKRSRVSDAPKGKRNASKSKKSQKGGSFEEDNNNGRLNRQSSSNYSSEDESNLSLELNNGGATSSTTLNSNGKTRASRGSATDPQSLYARKRRERINERLRTLQGLVPNGTKVDISTMLEEAVQYVKFLQLQIKLLSSEDLWMYAPIAYNGMDIGLDYKINLPK